MRIGIVNPYSWDVPGGVQYHIRDLAGELIQRGHSVSVLTPSSHSALPEWAVSVGASVPIRFNGSVARLSFGPVVSAKTRRWVEEGNFDLLHIHEPTFPSISFLAAVNAKVPIVGTFHSALDHSYTREFTASFMRPVMERISARIAVSAEARRTLIEHHGGDAIIIPNGVYISNFSSAQPTGAWRETADSPVIVFLGRLDEPRKGLSIFAQAIPFILQQFPRCRFMIAGRGNAEDIRKKLNQFGDRVSFIGGISDTEKESLLKGATAYVAPQTGGESFGIVLIEAMAAGTTVIASDLEAFRAVLAGGKGGHLFETGNYSELANSVISVLSDRPASKSIALRGQEIAKQYDWQVVTDRICAVYQTVLGTSAPINNTESSAFSLLRKRFQGG